MRPKRSGKVAGHHAAEHLTHKGIGTERARLHCRECEVGSDGRDADRVHHGRQTGGQHGNEGPEQRIARVLLEFKFCHGFLFPL